MSDILSIKYTEGVWEGIKVLRGKPGKDGIDGKDYTITENDYDAIADVVLTKLVSAESVSV